MSGFGFSVFLLIGLVGVGATQYVYQEIIYWCSHKEKLQDKSDEYFLRGLGYWTLGFYITSGITGTYLSLIFTRCNYEIHNSSLRAIASARSVFFDKIQLGE